MNYYNEINNDKAIGILICKRENKFIIEYYDIIRLGDESMYYHATQTKGIKVLEPRVSNHNKPLVYFSNKKENVLVYLSNAVEKFCKENNFEYNGIWSKWASYGFTKDGILEIQEYYKNATYETYKGVSGYIYKVEEVDKIEKQNDIPFAFTTNEKVKVVDYEYVSDAYEAIMEEVRKGTIALVKYEDFIKTKKDWLIKTIQKEYDEATNHPEYRYFLINKFPFIKK